MNYSNLNSKHLDIPDQTYRGSELHTKISINFAINELLNLAPYGAKGTEKVFYSDIQDRINNLRRRLNEEV